VCHTLRWTDLVPRAGFSHPTTVSPSSYVTPYTPLKTDETEAATEIHPGEPIKIQLGAQIDGFGSIVCDTILAPAEEKKAPETVSGRPADLILATHYANELLLRLMLPPGTLASGTDEEKAKASAVKAPPQSKITQLLEKVVKAYDCNLVESTTSWLFDRNEIEGKKKIILSPGEGTKGEGTPEIGEVWGVEIGVSLGTGKVKTLENRATLHRRTLQTYGLKRPTSRKILNEVQKKFGTFPFSLRQLEDERDAKSGVVECVRGNVFRQYEVVGDKEGAPVARLLTTIGELLTLFLTFFLFIKDGLSSHDKSSSLSRLHCLPFGNILLTLNNKPSPRMVSRSLGDLPRSMLVSTRRTKRSRTLRS
jgi:methionine aminopeptidase